MSKYLPGMSDYEKGFADGNRARKALQDEIKTDIAEIEKEARIDTLKEVHKQFRGKAWGEPITILVYLDAYILNCIKELQNNKKGELPYPG